MYKNGWTRDKVMKVIRERNIGLFATNGDKCFYRQDVNGQTNCCLVGAFIPDDKYDPEMEEKPAGHIINEFGLESDMPMPLAYMKKLQYWHDETGLEHQVWNDDPQGEDFYKAVEKQLIRMEYNLKA